MIIINIKGGIGNQFFQYALGRKLSLLNKADLKFDTSLFSEDLFGRKFKLNIFNTVGDIATKNEISKIKGSRRELEINNELMYNSGLLSKIYRMFYWRYYRLTYTNSNVVNELTHLRFDNKILKVMDNTYLNGFWPHYQYFEDIREILLKEFQLKPKYQTNDFLKKKAYINSLENPISIHFRRGYANRDWDLNYFGVLPMTYYEKAINIIINKIINPTFLIFSDDINWVKVNLKTDQNHEYIDLGKNPDSDYLELILMSYCKHNIIANSSFSWWAAWINENCNKEVISPKKWYIGKNGLEITTNHAPPSWTKS